MTPNGVTPPKLGRRRDGDVRRRGFAAARVRTEGRFPTRDAALFFVNMVSPRHHPGEGRGPVRGRSQPRVARRYYGLPNWAPAFAGVVLGCWTAGRADLESSAWQIQEKGRLSARSGPTFWSVDTPKSTPAKAGAQLGDGGATCCPPLLQPSRLGPGLRRGGAGDWLHGSHNIRARERRDRPPNLSARAGRRRGVAASGGGRGGAAVPDRRDRNARRSTGSPGSPCHHKSENRARRDGRAAICRSGR